MKLDEGNIFEALRLVLPEHRSVMSFVKNQRSKRTRPILSEDKLDELQYTLQEAMDTGSKVSLTLYHPYEDVILQGTLSANGRTILISTGQQVIEVNLGNITDIQSL